mmetsp:Transcript_2104/g.6285  ORF Transcript_2104/g.6285 Transcript_2104/m.6285 type:complete len:222 (-) Transcript_2104:470-1135(-)
MVLYTYGARLYFAYPWRGWIFLLPQPSLISSCLFLHMRQVKILYDSNVEPRISVFNERFLDVALVAASVTVCKRSALCIDSVDADLNPLLQHQCFKSTFGPLCKVLPPPWSKRRAHSNPHSSRNHSILHKKVSHLGHAVLLHRATQVSSSFLMTTVKNVCQFLRQLDRGPFHQYVVSVDDLGAIGLFDGLYWRLIFNFAPFCLGLFLLPLLLALFLIRQIC